MVVASLALALPAFRAAADEPGEAPEASVEAESAEAAPGRGRPTEIEEITVTARKRTERLQETPVAITHFSETDLRDQQVERLDKIMQNVPNLLLTI